MDFDSVASLAEAFPHWTVEEIRAARATLTSPGDMDTLLRVLTAKTPSDAQLARFWSEEEELAPRSNAQPTPSAYQMATAYNVVSPLETTFGTPVETGNRRRRKTGSAQALLEDYR